MQDLPHLLSAGRIGSLETRNRIVMSPMGSNLAEPDGHLGERILRYYEERARGGVGLIIVGVAAVAYPAGACNPNQMGISDDVFLPGLAALAARVHAHGAKIAVQLQHAGKVATQDMGAGRPMWVPSPPTMKAGDLFSELSPAEAQRATVYLARPGAKIHFHPMTVDDIRRLVRLFSDAAERAKRAGYDGVEIHGAHGYLLSSFLSPAANRRTDEYGGPLQNRARLLLEVIRGVRDRVGVDFPVWCRLDATEIDVPNGISVDDARRTAEMVEAAGADAIHVSAYADPTSGAAFTKAPLVHQPCGYVDLAAAIKRRVHIPVIAVGRIEPEEADVLIREQKADFVAMARKLLADPHLPSKLAAGHSEQIRPCIYCYSCVGRIFLNESVRCAVNPATGREADFSITPAEQPRRVLVAGGGPAGMETARIAAARGHRVTLYERSDHLGGALALSSLFRPENGRLVDHLELALRELGVEIRLGEALSAERCQQIDPDVLVVAVGSPRRRPSLPGVDRTLVLGLDDLGALLDSHEGDRSHTSLPRPRRVESASARLLDRDPGRTEPDTAARFPLGRRVAVIGGDLIGVEIAEFLSERGRLVTVLEEAKTLASNMPVPRRWRALDELRRRGARLLTRARVLQIDDGRLSYCIDGAAPETLEADSVILTVASPAPADTVFARATKDVRFVGDCAGTVTVEDALREATRTALSI